MANLQRRIRDDRDTLTTSERNETFRETLAPVSQRPIVYESGSSYSAAANVVYVLLGLLQALLALRFLFLLFGANAGSLFVNFVYALSEPFVAPFNGIFGVVDVAGSTAIFDGSTLIAMLVYAIIAWALIRLIAAITNRAT